MKKLYLWTVVLTLCSALILIFSLVGCETETAAETTAAETTAAETTAAETTAAETTAAEEKLVFAMVARDISDPFHAIMADGAKAKCEELGIEFVLKDSQADMTTQLNVVDNVISLGVDGVAFNAVDGGGAIPAIEALNNAGIPVVGFDTIASGGECLAEVGVDNLYLSKLAGEAMIEVLKEKHGGEVPEGIVLNIMGSVNMQIGIDRSEGFHQALKDYPQLTIAEAQGMWNPDDAYKVTADLITKYGDEIVGIYTAAGIMCDGIVSAVENAGYDLTKIAFTDIGGFAIDIELIKAGKLDQAVVVPALEHGEYPIEYLYYYNMGQTDKIPKAGDEVGGVPVTQGVTGPKVSIPCLLCPKEIEPDNPRIFGNMM